jgi:hypothetical protein
MKLGEALVRESLITKEQLKQALERQVMFGGRIGTNLVELKVLREEELLKFLGKYFRVNPVGSEMLTSIPEDVLSSIEKTVVEKYRILPFRKERKRLYVAMLNPNNVAEIDELRFLTGYDIIPYVITELRLLFALEKYYGLKPELRFISLTDPFAETAEPEEKDAVESIKRAFTEVRDVEEIAGILFKEAHKIATRTALFTVKGEMIRGWKARGLTIDGFETIANEPSIFSDVLATKSHFRGPLLRIKGNEAMIEILSGTPQDSLLMPIIVRDRAVMLLYADNGIHSVLNANIGYLSRLASMAAVAFEIIILRKRILDM